MNIKNTIKETKRLLALSEIVKVEAKTSLLWSKILDNFGINPSKIEEIIRELPRNIRNALKKYNDYFRITEKKALNKLDQKNLNSNRKKKIKKVFAMV